MTPFKYVSASPAPADYKCSKCGASGCKLWRQYQTFLDHIELMCAPCSMADQGETGVEVDADGKHETSYRGASWSTDQFGWLCPAVPTEDGETFWGYCAVPADGVAWWRALPSYPQLQEVRP